uniref:C2 domain-containing protein n=1 Tax=Dunaliella tertiolecta TaxID=3047 RepID=A0A7S3R2T6_DUNTE
MAPEDMVAARLLAAFREYKRREAVGLAAYYANKLAALEDALLASREHLFALSELAAAAGAGQGSSEAGHEVATLGATLKEAVAHTAGLEKEVAETRQLKEEEEMHMLNAVYSMQAMYDQMLELRVSQGYWLTGLELRVEQQPPEEAQWSMGTGVPRDRLDAELLVVEEEAIAGLPPPPYPFPLPPSMHDLPDNRFAPRRLETMCASHAQLVADLSSRLDSLKTQSSTDPNDPVVLQLEDQLRALGPAPRRLAPVTPAQRAEALTHAAQRVSVGDVGVPRNPRLVPILTMSPHHTSHPNMAAVQQEQQEQMLQEQELASTAQAMEGANPTNQRGSTAVIMLDGQLKSVPVKPQAISREAPQGPFRAPRMGTRSNTRYVAKLHVNGHFVDRTRGLMLEEGFAATFNEVFSVQLLRWPESITVHLCEQGAIRDTLISVIHVAVPGFMGTPHIDPCHKHYQFTSQVPHHLKTKGMQLPATRTPGGGPHGQPQVIYPTGVLHVQCGWVSEDAPAGTHMSDEAAHRADRVVTYNNPLAHGEPAADVEAPTNVMPPVPKVAIDRMLRRAANRIGGKANRQQVLKWLSQHAFDPNDPHNAPLMELMKAHEATSGGVGDEFNLDVPPDVAMEGDRQQAKRAAFLARRWATGTFRDPEKSVLKGTRRIRIPTVLSAADTEEMEHMYTEALSLVELAPGGSGPAVAKAMNARQDRAMMMQVGPSLTRGIEEREARIKDFGLRIRSAATRIAGGKQAARKYKTEDVVNDTPLPEFKVDFQSLLSLVMPRRPLKRERKVIKSLVTSVPAETQLVVTIQRAANLPVRAPAARAGWQSGNDLGVPDQYTGVSVPVLSPAHCFVEVRFRGLSRRTVTSSSQWPYWNEQVLIPVFDTEQEPSTTALLESRDDVTINVFDEVIVDRVGPPRIPRINSEDAISQPLKYPERERRFLGSTHVPLSAIYQMQVMEGTLRLEVPPVLLGYTQLSERPPCVTLCLSLRPRLAPPPAAPEALLSGEVEEVTRHARMWISDLIVLPQCRTRVIRALAMEPDGTSLLVTRFVAPTPLPPHLLHLASTINMPPFSTVSPTEAVMLKLARFVALVPYLEDSAMQKRRADVWTTSAQVMAMAAGDAEEHAHLLVGFFLEIGQQAFVVMGASLNGAKSYFVLTTGAPAYDPSNPQVKPHFDWPDVQLRIWNPLTGSVVSVKDPTAELREVGMIYDNSNMWANVQQEAQPWNMTWNLLSPLHWRPFFGTQLPPRELGTVQTTPIYEEREDLLYEQMETRVEEIVRDSLTRARSLGAFVTKPDNKVSRVLKQLLAEVPAAMEGISAASLAASLALAQAQAQGLLPGGIEAGGSRLGERHQAISALQARHNAIVAHESRAEWVNGHILAIPFSDRYAEALTEAVLNTGIHRIADERVKYSMAAHVEHAGAAFCCCLWVYVAVTR